jgi:hypothetical protein
MGIPDIDSSEDFGLAGCIHKTIAFYLNPVHGFYILPARGQQDYTKDHAQKYLLKSDAFHHI